MTGAAVDEQTATKLDAALKWARRGMRLFPIKAGTKTPVHKGWAGAATTDEASLTKWILQHPEFNVGMATGDPLPNGRYLLVLDVDMKLEDGKLKKNGEASLIELCKETGTDPAKLVKTLTQHTPSGQRDGEHYGGHMLFSTRRQLGNSVDKLGPGLDTRGLGGYILVDPSTIDGKAYQVADWDAPFLELPEAIEARLSVVPEKMVDRTPPAGIDPKRAEARAVDYLKTAPPAVEGEGGDAATFRVIAKVKDLGVSQDEALALMLEHWNDRCSPPWDEEELADKVANAFKYGREQQGCDAPEAVFPKVAAPGPDDPAPVSHPVHGLNLEFAFTPAGGGHVIQETTDAKGRYTVKHLDMGTFKAMHANRLFQSGSGKPRPISEHWMEWANRREYDGFVFAPCREVDPRWFNLWHGFAVEPVTKARHKALDAFLEHALKNVCSGDPQLFNWLMGYFAHLIQRPWNKPLVALVFRGLKGTGKNALVERVGYLLGAHFLVADDDRYLLSNFNGHLENCLMLVLDEATWAGDKKAEGRLKGLVTGSDHVIEQKGREPYRVDNLTRVVILGNEEWLVPASQDERRFAVFSVGNGRRQDRNFFQGMREGMEAGGYAHLLRYFLDFDLSGIEVNEAPNTQALVDQKRASLTGAAKWLDDVLAEEEIQGCPWGDAVTVSKGAVYEAYSFRSAKKYREFKPQDRTHFWTQLREMLPGMKDARPGGVKSVVFPPLAEARAAFSRAMGGKVSWGESGDDVDIFS